MKKGNHEQTSEALFIWFSQLRNLVSPVSGRMLQAKTVGYHKNLKDGDENFTASDGWLDRWKKKFRIRQLNISGENLSFDTSGIARFWTKLRK